MFWNPYCQSTSLLHSEVKESIYSTRVEVVACAETKDSREKVVERIDWVSASSLGSHHLAEAREQWVMDSGEVNRGRTHVADQSRSLFMPTRW